ncbi:MAG: taurine dioxygenase [Acidimicrobiales bacterium]|nr:taurine dioxygenase [Acidimicrobiales bacterium]
MKVSALPGFGGAEISEIDLREPIAEDDQLELRALYAQRRLLVFRDQDLSYDDQIRAVSTFGPVVDEFGDGSSASMVSNLDPDAFLPITERLYFHSDRTYTPHPLLALSLYGMDISPDVTCTRYVSPEAAFHRLPSELARRIVTMVAVDMADYSDPKHPDLRPLRHRLPDELPATAFPRQAHPIVLTHPVTHDPVLYVGQFTTVWIEGVERGEGNDLLDELFSYIYDEDYVYEHHWRAQDLVIWDNVALQHGRDALRTEERRALRRVSISHAGWSDFFQKLGALEPQT